MTVDSDLFFVLGLALAILAIPAMISAYSAGRPPRVAMVASVIGGLLIVLALSFKPSGYRPQEIPAVISKVVQRYLG